MPDVQVAQYVKINLNGTYRKPRLTSPGPAPQPIQNKPLDHFTTTWYDDGKWDSHGMVYTGSGAWQSVEGGTHTVHEGDKIPMGFEDNGNGIRNVQVRIELDNKIVKEVDFGNTTQNITFFQVPIGFFTDPTYLETLDKLDQWTFAQYIPNKGRNQLNL